MSLPSIKPILAAAAICAAPSSSPSFHRLEFHQEPLSVVAVRLNEVSRRQLRIADSFAGQKPISGLYAADDPKGFVLGILDLYPDLMMHETDDGWIIEKTPTLKQVQLSE